jgi:protein-S-isoprenylcysteine O-methyltransferase Ste14
MNSNKALIRSALVLYFVIAFEVLIMISPFAGFFYSVFNPVLLKFAAYSSTRWLSAFFLPHMILPQDGFLQFVRVMGSILFVAGAATFLICAGQIYYAKFAKKGAVLKGLYSVIRHPQYLALGVTGLGLAILWPRFLTVVLWIVMALVYYLLAKDEERRMLNAYEATYRAYMNKTGMFFPKAIEHAIPSSSVLGKVALGIGFGAVALGSAFLLRFYTIDHLTLWTKSSQVTGVAILPEDGFKMEHRMSAILDLPDVKGRLQAGKRYLVYFIPQNYIMQGMIADTGGDWKLYNQHHSMAMITDWIFNPFGHLREGHHAMHSAMMHSGAQMPCQQTVPNPDAVMRRLIFLSIEGIQSTSPPDLFSINALRVPEFMADVEVHEMNLMSVQDLEHGSGWGTVPTPVF